MAGDMEIDIKQVARIGKIMKKLEREGSSAEAPLKKFGIWMMQETGKTFRAGGRGPIKWTPLSEMALAMRKHRGGGANPKRILQLTGNLMQNVRHAVEKMRYGWDSRLFNPTPYAPMHQFGGEIHSPSKVIVPKKAKALRFIIGGKVIFAKRVVIPAMTRKVPKRQFLFFLPRDVEKAAGLLKGHLDQSAGRAVKE